MAATKQTHSAAPTWTASQLANVFRDAFIGAGLMASWYDSFLSDSVENRILEITYDGSKTYGKCYYWFQFTTTFAGVSVASGWNASTHQPTGTQYLDFFSTATNTTANHYSIAGTLFASTEVAIVRYTSGAHSWFVLRNGATPFPFMITPGSATIVPWLDLSKTFFHHFVAATLTTRSSTAVDASGAVAFRSQMQMRRSFVAGQAVRTATEFPNNYNRPTMLNSYHSLANAEGSFTQNAAYVNGLSIINLDGLSTIVVPAGLNNTNPAYTSNYVPILFGISYSPYVNTPLPADFAIHFPFTATQFAFGDSIVVTAGVEEWEVLAFANNNQTTSPNPLLLARMV